VTLLYLFRTLFYQLILLSVLQNYDLFFYIHKFKNKLLRTHRANLLLWVLTEVRVDCFCVTSRELYIRSEREKMFKKFYIQHSCVSVCAGRDPC